MSTLTAPRNGPPAPSPGTRLLGEILTRSAGGVRVKHRDLVGALRDSGLDEGVARELAPRHALSRACRKLAKERLIRQAGEDATRLRFQFTREAKARDRFEYQPETMLALAKAPDTLTCGAP